MERHGDAEMDRHGEWESGREGDESNVQHATASPTRPLAHSPTLPLSASPRPRVPASDLRILLWDIDGTLIRSLRVGAYKEYTIPVLEEVFGTSGQLANMRVSGM